MTVYRVIHGVSALRTDEEAQRVGQELERRFGDRPIVAAEVVELARKARSPLHPYFEWDDTTAAEMHRMAQAKELVRAIAVTRSDRFGGQRTRAWHNVTLLTGAGRQRAYVPERIVWSTPELADQVVARAERELRGWHDRYSSYRELRSAGELVGEALGRLAEAS